MPGGFVMWFLGGQKVTVSLVDGSVVQGRTQFTWPGRLRLVEVKSPHGDVPGYVVVYARSVLTVQVVT